MHLIIKPPVEHQCTFLSRLTDRFLYLPRQCKVTTKQVLGFFSKGNIKLNVDYDAEQMLITLELSDEIYDLLWVESIIVSTFADIDEFDQYRHAPRSLEKYITREYDIATNTIVGMCGTVIHWHETIPKYCYRVLYGNAPYDRTFNQLMQAHLLNVYRVPQPNTLKFKVYLPYTEAQVESQAYASIVQWFNDLELSQQIDHYSNYLEFCALAMRLALTSVLHRSEVKNLCYDLPDIKLRRLLQQIDNYFDSSDLDQVNREPRDD